MFSSQFKRAAARKFARWSSAVAEPMPKTSTGSSEGGSFWVTALGVGGTAGLIYTWVKLSSDTSLEVELKQKAVERKMNNVVRADPVAMSKEIADYLRFTEPEASPQLVQLGVHLCVQGYSEDLESHDKFYIIRKFKEKNNVMSWADLGSFIAYHALLEMGAPLVGIAPYFGRSESQAAEIAKMYKPLPPTDATYDDLMQWGRQFELTPAETVAVLGGQPQGSVLFGTSGRAMEVSHQYYKNILRAQQTGDLDSVLYAKALTSDEYGSKCLLVFADDELYWNRYFVDGLKKVLLHKWDNLRELPNRMLGTTTDPTWATRQKLVYGVQHDYTGSTTR
eukprot:TRINITY_DN4784_c0_g1_i1.p1 TRINITY_DN4784_c0_g1~~TRINITY_DN4784_c0_g1_i1.p1  ORF type:complete len:336 (+),score=116.33 TRINITY_DN4784_c0_g1_i1:57-1064(+)